MADEKRDVATVNDSIKGMNLFQRLSEITFEIGTVAKSKEIGYGSARYKAAVEPDVLNAIKPIEHKWRVWSGPVGATEIIREETIEKEGKDGKKVSQIFVRIRVVYRFFNIDQPDEYVDVMAFGDGIDTGDKALGKAMTYANKYALMKMYKIVTGDDPDEEASPESGYRWKNGGNNGNRRNNQNNQNAGPPPAGPRQPPNGDTPVICENCGKRLPDWFDGNTLIKAADLGTDSKNQFGRILCADCRK